MNVKSGDVWKANGHTFICEDVIECHRSDLLASLMPEIDVIYVDPPWSQSSYTRFQRQAGVSEKPVETFLRELVSVLQDIRPKGLGIEMGMENAQLVWELLKEAGALTWDIGNATYGQRRPMQVWLGSFTEMRRDITVPGKLHGLELPTWVMDVLLPLPGLTYFDPCCGKITFGQLAIQRGAKVFGCEIIPAKLEQGLDALAKMGLEVYRE